MLVKYNLPDQPIPVFVGSPDLIASSQLYVNETRYELGTFLKAIDLCYKSFFVLNASYPKASVHIWTFLQVFVYNMKDHTTKNFTSVNKLISAIQKISTGDSSSTK